MVCLCACFFFLCVWWLPDQSSRLRWQSTAGQYLETHYWQNLWRNILWVHDAQTHHTHAHQHTRVHVLTRKFTLAWSLHSSLSLCDTHTQIHTTWPAARDSADIITQMSAPKKCPWTLPTHTDVHSGGKKPQRIAHSNVHTCIFIQLFKNTTIFLFSCCVFLSLSPSFSQIATYWHALKHLAKCVVTVFPLSVTLGMLLNGLLDFIALSLSRSPSGFHPLFQSQTYTYLWLFTCHGSQLLMIHPTVIFIPLHHLAVIMGETANNSRVRLNGSVLRCNLNVAFLGSPLSVSPLLPWLPVKSFALSLCGQTLFFSPKGVFVCNDAGIYVRQM